MFRYLFTIAVFLLTCSTPAKAFLPDYPDDAEFKQCTKVSNNWDACVREETRRSLNTIKKQYRFILTHPKIKNWHDNPAENIETMRDLYESWLAFRNRLCSLAKASTRFLEPVSDEKDACTLYYTLHHQDHLNSIALLLDNKAPKNSFDFDFMRIYDHDKLYKECIQRNMESKCIDEELKRTANELKLQYEVFVKDYAVGKWNNGNGLESGNYRDMYDSWIAYRNRMCSLAVWAYQQAYGHDSITLNQCLQFYSREKFEALRNLIRSAHSTLDEDEETPEELNDGGEKEGQTITPLTRKIEKGSDDSLSEPAEIISEKKEQSEEQEDQNKSSKNVNIPAWATH